MIAQLPTLSPGQIETFVLSGAALCALILLARKAFARGYSLEAEFVTREEFRLFRSAVERDLAGLRDRIDSRHLTMLEALDKLRADLLGAGECREGRIQQRLLQLESAVARVDERTKQ